VADSCEFPFNVPNYVITQSGSGLRPRFVALRRVGRWGRWRVRGRDIGSGEGEGGESERRDKRDKAKESRSRAWALRLSSSRFCPSAGEMIAVCRSRKRAT
jgi:hypothetical protein